MSLSIPSDRLGEALLRAQVHWHERHNEEGDTSHERSCPTPLTIAISREAGASGSVVAARLGERLGWPVYDRELLNRIAAEMGLRTHLLESVDEKRLNWLLGYVQTFAGPNSVSEGAYVTHLMRVALSLATHGKCILVGRGTAQFLPADSTLRVRIVAPLADRVRSVEHRFNVPLAEAARRVADTEYQRGDFVRAKFHKDPDNPADYDLVLNTARFTPVECAELIEQALLRRQARVNAGVGAKARVA